MVLSALSQCRTTDPQSMATQCQLLMYYADSIYENQEYKRAEVVPEIQNEGFPIEPQCALLFFNLSNARRFCSSMGKLFSLMG